MRVARVLLASFSGFDLKCFRIDRAAGAGASEASWALANAPAAGRSPIPERQLVRELRAFSPEIVHVYGTSAVPHTLITVAGVPWIADRRLEVRRPLLGRRPRARSKSLIDDVAEPVDDEFFAAASSTIRSERPTIGTLRRGSRTASSRELAAARIRRFRDDVEWLLFDTHPGPEAMAALSLWVDPTGDEEDLDGLVCEAIVLGVPVVATRTTANRRRTDDGRAAALCPTDDPNELAHAIVTMLFKPERSAPLCAVARTLRERFRPARRREALLAAYAEVLG